MSPRQYCTSDGVVLRTTSANPLFVELVTDTFSFSGTITADYDDISTEGGCSRLEAIYDIADH